MGKTTQDQKGQPAQRMDPELKAKWVAALRSGKYQQAEGGLYNGHGFCCLGVYALINGVSGNEMGDHTGVVDIGGVTCLHDLPRGVREKLSEMNDYGKSFPEIADYIEANL